jgi:hypothetical protein
VTITLPPIGGEHQQQDDGGRRTSREKPADKAVVANGPTRKGAEATQRQAGETEGGKPVQHLPNWIQVLLKGERSN